MSSVNGHVPNPGSDAGRRLGCICPVVDNGHGKSPHLDEDGAEWWVFFTDCPLHGAGDWNDS